MVAVLVPQIGHGTITFIELGEALQLNIDPVMFPPLHFPRKLINWLVLTE